MATPNSQIRNPSFSSINRRLLTGNHPLQVTCQMCEQAGHIAAECQWVYSSCLNEACQGIRLLFTSHTSANPGRKYLKCQFGHCTSGIQWLDEALLEVPSKGGCFKCEQVGHWVIDCPWIDSNCARNGCRGKRILRSSEQPLTLGWKFLKCYTCGHFQWLKDAIIEDGNTVATRNDPTVSINMRLSDFCNAFNSTRI